MTSPSEARIRREALEEAARFIEAYRDDMPETVASAGLRFHLAAAIRARAELQMKGLLIAEITREGRSIGYRTLAAPPLREASGEPYARQGDAS